MTRPILLVDFDGVINVPALGRPDHEFELVFVADGLHHHVPHGTGSRFAQLEGAFDPVWATAWEGLAPFLLAPHLGFGADWPVIHFGAGSLRAMTWKLADVRRWYGSNGAGRRLAWLDDDLGPDADAWAADRDHMLLVRTNETEGLTDGQVHRLLAWSAATARGRQAP